MKTKKAMQRETKYILVSDINSRYIKSKAKKVGLQIGLKNI